MAKVKRFTEKDLKKITILQKLENDAYEAKKKKHLDEAVNLFEQCVTGWKELLAGVDSSNVKKTDTNPDVKFETDDLTKKIISKYFGINIKKEDK